MGAPPSIELASLGMADSLILMVLALVVFGPRRLPQIGRQIGKLMYEFRKASNDFKFQMEEELRLAEEADRRKREEAERQRIAAQAAVTQVSAPVESIEAQAGIGAVETPIAAASTYPEQYPPETPAPAAAAETPAIQPPQTGEQVSASAPFAAAMEEAVSELNPDAAVEANAASVEATGASGDASAVTVEADTAATEANGSLNSAASPEVRLPGAEETAALIPSTPVESVHVEASTPPKEPVSQHG